jgi:hypothetical protein
MSDSVQLTLKHLNTLQANPDKYEIRYAFVMKSSCSVQKIDDDLLCQITNCGKKSNVLIDL